jgi:hypothetical protein
MAAPSAAAGTTAEALQRLSVSIDALDAEDSRIEMLDPSASAAEQARARSAHNCVPRE